MVLLDLKDEQMEDLRRLAEYVLVPEDQGVTPRYGWETVDRIIKPSEIYDEAKASSLLTNAKMVVESTKKL